MEIQIGDVVKTFTPSFFNDEITYSVITKKQPCLIEAYNTKEIVREVSGKICKKRINNGLGMYQARFLETVNREKLHQIKLFLAGNNL